jgi:DNA-binding CsgD family transcriptional regulator
MSHPPSNSALPEPVSPRIWSLAAELFAPGLDVVSFRNRTAILLREAIGCEVVTFATLDCRTRHLEVIFDPMISDLREALPGFGRYMADYPCFSFDPTVNNGRPFLRADFLPDAEFYASPIYREGFAKAGISDHAAILVSATEKEIFFIGLEMLGGTFRPEHRDLMALLQPHIVNAHDLTQTRDHLGKVLSDSSVFRRAGLSVRQAEMLCLLAAGKSNPEIATILNLQTSTVKSYIHTLFNKLGVDNRHAAILRALELARPISQPAPGSGRLRTPTQLPR